MVDFPWFFVCLPEVSHPDPACDLRCLMVVPPVVITVQNLCLQFYMCLQLRLNLKQMDQIIFWDIIEMPQFAAIEFTLAPGHHAQNDSARCTKCTKCRDLEPCRLSRYMQVPAGSRCRSTHPRLRPSQAYRPCQSPCSRSTHGVGLRRRRDIFMFTSNRDAQGRLVCFCFADFCCLFQTSQRHDSCRILHSTNYQSHWCKPPGTLVDLKWNEHVVGGFELLVSSPEYILNISQYGGCTFSFLKSVARTINRMEMCWALWGSFLHRNPLRISRAHAQKPVNG